MILRWPPAAFPPDIEGIEYVPVEWEFSEEGPAQRSAALVTSGDKARASSQMAILEDG
jgi:hypothetical protein